jgi:hypothetical protein
MKALLLPPPDHSARMSTQTPKSMLSNWLANSGMKTADEHLAEHLPKSEIPVLDQLYSNRDRKRPWQSDQPRLATTATETVINRMIAGTYTLIRSRIDNTVQE